MAKSCGACRRQGSPCAPAAFPGKKWARTDAQELELDGTKLSLIAEKMREAKSNGVLIHKGRLIDEWSFGGGRDKRFDIQSCTKSVTSFAVGLAIGSRHIASADMPVKQAWPDLEAGPFSDRITFRHFLTMTAGLVQLTDYGLHRDWHHPTEYAEPGTRYSYQNDQYKALASALTYLHGRELSEVMNEALAPLGAAMEWGSEPRWDPDVVSASGKRLRVNCGYSRARFTASDLARLGHLYLQKGLWCGERIISEDYVAQSLTPNPVFQDERPQKDDGDLILRGYGFGWRMHEYRGITTWGMHGYGNQFCVIIPELDLVMTKLSDWTDRSTWVGNSFFYPLLVDSML